MHFDDMAEFELNIQLDRLKYIDTLLNRRTYCDFPPRKIYIEPTNICNLKCVHCVHDGALTRKPGYMDFDLYTDMIDQVAHLAKHTKLQFTGVGEPLFHKDLFRMIRYAADKGFFTLMNSNATMLTPDKCEQLMDSGLDYLHISIDGITKETYENIRRGGDFEQVINNICSLFKAKYEKEAYHLAVILGIVDQERNREEVQQCIEFFQKFPFHHVVSGELFSQMGTVEEASDNYADKMSLPREEHPLCNTPFDLLSFNCDGNAVGCNYDFDNRYIIGNAREEKVLDIWNSERMQQFRQSLFDRQWEDFEGNGPLCSECTIKWQPDYAIPKDFHSEVARMKEYLDRAIDRCSGHVARNAEFREKEKQFLANKDALLEELWAFGK